MPSSAVRRFTDPHPYGAAIRAAEIELFPTSKGAFRAELTHVTLDRLWIQRGSENLPRVFVGAVKPERAAIGFLTDDRQPAKLHCGHEVRPGEVVVNSTKLIHRRTQAASRWGSMSLAPDVLAAVSHAVLGRELNVPDASHTIKPDPALMGRLLDLHADISSLAKTSPDVFNNPETARALENNLIHLMVRCLDQAPSGASTADWNHSKIVTRFEAFLEENIFQPIYLAEICAATGASERTLRACCQQYLGMGPVQYLWLRRMHLARRALALATPQTATVTNTALDHGFWELGRFSTQYKSLFGESPSETLRRPQDDARYAQ